MVSDKFLSCFPPEIRFKELFESKIVPDDMVTTQVGLLNSHTKARPPREPGGQSLERRRKLLFPRDCRSLRCNDTDPSLQIILSASIPRRSKIQALAAAGISTICYPSEITSWYASSHKHDSAAAAAAAADNAFPSFICHCYIRYTIFSTRVIVAHEQLRECSSN